MENQKQTKDETTINENGEQTEHDHAERLQTLKDEISERVFNNDGDLCAGAWLWAEEESEYIREIIGDYIGECIQDATSEDELNLLTEQFKDYQDKQRRRDLEHELVGQLEERKRASE